MSKPAIEETLDQALDETERLADSASVALDRGNFARDQGTGLIVELLTRILRNQMFLLEHENSPFRGE